jgi:hypothetical protein
MWLMVRFPIILRRGIFYALDVIMKKGLSYMLWIFGVILILGGFWCIFSLKNFASLAAVLFGLTMLYNGYWARRMYLKEVVKE